MTCWSDQFVVEAAAQHERDHMSSRNIPESIEVQIVSGELVPRSKLPSERVLAKRFSCSRQAVREALAELRSRGILETRHGSGSIVRGLLATPDQTTAIEGLCRTYSRMIYDVFDLREILESRAAGLAAEQASRRDRYRVGEAYKAMRNVSAEDTEGHALADFAFHRSIAEAAQSPVLAHTLDALSRLFAQSVRTSVNNLYGRAAERSKIDDQHKALFDAVMAGDRIAAEAAASLHIQSVRSSLESIEKLESDLVRE